MQALAANPVFWLLLVVVLVVVYLLPTLIAVIRGTDRLALVFLVNLIGAPSGVGSSGPPISSSARPPSSGPLSPAAVT